MIPDQRTYRFRAVGRFHARRFYVQCPALEGKGATASGDTVDEAYGNLREKLYSIIPELERSGVPIPAEPDLGKEVITNPYRLIAITIPPMYRAPRTTLYQHQETKTAP